jgi:hypothetical protein
MFLVATMVKTLKDNRDDIGNWKTSAMPTLLYSLPQEARQDLISSSTWSMTNSGETKKVKIRLMPKKGWRVSGQVCASPTLDQRALPRPPPGWI